MSGRALRIAACSLFLSGWGASTSGCAPAPLDVSVSEIVGGTRETGYPAVYFLYRLDGAACTAALISPRVVLTARHCVASSRGSGAAPPSMFRLYVGSDPRSFTAEYRVSRVEILPGSTSAIGDGRAQDIALLVLASPARETPYDIARDRRPSTLVGGEPSTAIGFGETPSGGSGVKMRVSTRVTAVDGGLLFVDPTVCSGDSGGPLIGPDGRIYGVASFIYSPDGRSEPRCGTAPGAYNEVYRHVAWINGVIESVGDACFPEDETCNGLDDDCDEEIDEVCLELGSPCSDGAECVGGLCASTPAGLLCSQSCDPMRPGLGCPPGFFCASSPGSCDGFCIPGTLGSAPLEAACASDVECASGVCRDPGDGRRRCLEPCRGDRGDCLDGNVCVAEGGACSVCVDASIFRSGRGLGEVCSDNAQCRSGLCIVRDGVGECSVPCDEATPCPDGFACAVNACVLAREQPIGGACLTSSDCARGAACATQGTRRWCTASCSPDAPCPAGFECVPGPDTSVCAPVGGLVGEPCAVDAECSTGLCRDGACTVPCGVSSRCGPGFLCRVLSDGTRGCVRPPRPGAGSGGCAANGEGRGAGGLVALSWFGLLRRRRR